VWLLSFAKRQHLRSPIRESESSRRWSVTGSHWDFDQGS